MIEGAEPVGLSADGVLIDGNGTPIVISTENVSGDFGMATGDFSKASPAETTLFTAPANGIVQINVISTQAFADGDGAQPQFSIGDQNDAAKWLALGAVYTDAAIDKPFLISGTVLAGDIVKVSMSGASGNTNTGSLNIGVTFAAT